MTYRELAARNRQAYREALSDISDAELDQMAEFFDRGDNNIDLAEVGLLIMRRVDNHKIDLEEEDAAREQDKTDEEIDYRLDKASGVR